MFVLHYFIPEEIGIDSPDEREVILSEIYRRFHPEEEDMFEMEIQGKVSYYHQSSPNERKLWTTLKDNLSRFKFNESANSA